MPTNRERMNLPFRIFVLGLLDRRELTFTEIRGGVARDYKEKEYRREEVRSLLQRFLDNKLISRKNLAKPERWNKCRYSYTLTERGRERIEYYERRLREEGLESSVA